MSKDKTGWGLKPEVELNSGRFTIHTPEHQVVIDLDKGRIYVQGDTRIYHFTPYHRGEYHSDSTEGKVVLNLITAAMRSEMR